MEYIRKEISYKLQGYYEFSEPYTNENHWSNKIDFSEIPTYPFHIVGPIYNFIKKASKEELLIFCNTLNEDLQSKSNSECSDPILTKIRVVKSILIEIEKVVSK